jgi:hypothetical protein
MPALTANDMTITRVRRRPGYRIYKLQFGDGAKTVPATGVPMPPLSAFRMKQVDFHQLSKITVNGYKYEYDEGNNSIRIKQSAGFTPAGTNAAENAHTHTENTAGSYTQNATTGSGASHNHAFTGTAVAAAPLGDVPTSHAPAATELRIMFWGIGS